MNTLEATFTLCMIFGGFTFVCLVIALIVHPTAQSLSDYRTVARSYLMALLGAGGIGLTLFLLYGVQR